MKFHTDHKETVTHKSPTKYNLDLMIKFVEIELELQKQSHSPA
jgi:hypothetical protein